MFQDLSGVFARPELLSLLSAEITHSFNNCFDCVLGIEARGFIVATAISQGSHRPLIMARKEGKLPGGVESCSYDLEYGRAVLQVQSDAFAGLKRVLVIDDVLATGGTMLAASKLILKAGATVAGFAVITRIGALSGEQKLLPHRVFSAFTADG